ncbi:MAG: hypothetical protein ABH869_07525 [Candidatus Omnitrophota bacterium]
MAKGRKKKKRVEAELIEENPIGRYMMILFLCITLMAGIFFAMRHFFLNSTFFEVKKVFINNDRYYPFIKENEKKLQELYAGRNIFSINLNHVKMLAREDFSELKNIEVSKVFPNGIKFDMVTRTPVAIISSADIVIDSEAIVLDRQEKREGLIEIRGLNFFLRTPKKGQKIKSRVLDKVLFLIGVLQQNIIEDKTVVEYIDISEKNNILFSLNGVTIKMGEDDFLRKAGVLREILIDPDMDVNDMNYIDLRFEEPVISLK